MLRDLKARLNELRHVVDTVYIEFVFTGDFEKAEQNEALQKLREDIQSRSYVTQAFFGRPVPIIVRFRSTLKPPRWEPYTPLTFDLNITGNLPTWGRIVKRCTLVLCV